MINLTKWDILGNCKQIVPESRHAKNIWLPESLTWIKKCLDHSSKLFIINYLNKIKKTKKLSIHKQVQLKP